ncbi:mobilization protein [uncultured Bacteroides sp.]|uniref:mobilization protein n=1 Tax=uncultured Bacteroides sp. TaxID=162156 RepID=UPI002AA6DE29|nr:mobilization protein [uncultured Bacteroides sp.]
MKNNILEYITLYVIVACAAVVIATLARIFAVSMGFDSFTAFIVFLVVLAIQVIVYLSIHVVLQNLMLPWIGNGLAKIPYFRKKIEQRQALPVVVEPQVEENNTETDIPESDMSLDDIRNEQQKNIVKEQEDILNVALDYTRKSFALYLSDEDLDVLSRNVRAYMNKLDEKELKPVKVKELSALDLRHFGWNIWNYFKPRNQMDIANFLKIVFPNIFRDVTEDSIKSHLKDDELKGVIKIIEKLV